MIEFIGKFHPLVLHMPIGFLVAVSIFEGLQLVLRKDFKQAIKHLYIYAALGFTLASILGLALISGNGYTNDLVDKHKWFSLALSAVVIFGAFFNFKDFQKTARGLLLVSLALMTVAGHFGGTITHGEIFPKDPVKMQGSGGTSEFNTKILPILEKKCTRCHGEEKQRGEYRLDTVAELMKAGESGEEPIVRNDPAKSNLIRLILLHEEHEYAMPPEGKTRLTDEETMTLIQWINVL